MVPARTGKMRRHFPVGEFLKDWKNRGNFLKILDKQVTISIGRKPTACFGIAMETHYHLIPE